MTIEVHTASFRTTRGYTIVAALCDELAFWPSENAAEPDYEVINALRPGMATIPGAMLLCASSPYARRGALWDAYRKHFGKQDDPILVWQAATRVMNPAVPERLIQQALEDDQARASAEYLGQFRSDIEGFVSREAVEACVDAGVLERAPMLGTFYSGFVDPSGGSGTDSMALAIGHREHNDMVVIDCLREVRPPFSPESTVAEFSSLLRSYHVVTVTGDRYAGEWPREQFSKHGIIYDAASKPKNDLYVDLLPLVNSRKIQLLDQAKMIGQLASLERRTARSGKDSIDHPIGGHDDLANVVGGVASLLAKSGFDTSLKWVADSNLAMWDRLSLANHIRRYG